MGFCLWCHLKMSMHMISAYEVEPPRNVLISLKNCLEWGISFIARARSVPQCAKIPIIFGIRGISPGRDAVGLVIENVGCFCYEILPLPRDFSPRAKRRGVGV